MPLLPLIFFVVFALIMLGGYIAARRRLTQPVLLAILMTAGGFLSMFLVSLTSGNNPLQAVFVGLLVGVTFSVVLLSMAYSFARRERRPVTLSASGGDVTLYAADTDRRPNTHAHDADAGDGDGGDGGE